MLELLPTSEHNHNDFIITLITDMVMLYHATIVHCRTYLNTAACNRSPLQVA